MPAIVPLASCTEEDTGPTAADARDILAGVRWEKKHRIEAMALNPRVEEHRNCFPGFRHECVDAVAGPHVRADRGLHTPDSVSFRGCYDAAGACSNESPALLATAKLLLDSLEISVRSAGARASPWSGSWVIDYSFPRESTPVLRGVRVGVNGSWRDNYLLGTRGGPSLLGGTHQPVNAYLLRDQKISGRQIRLRAGIKTRRDLDNRTIRKTGFTSLANGANIDPDAYVMPAQFDLSVTVKF